MNRYFIFSFLVSITINSINADLSNSAVRYAGSGNETALLYFENNPNEAQKAMLLSGFQPLRVLRDNAEIFVFYQNSFGQVVAHKYVGIVRLNIFDFPDGIYWAKFSTGLFFKIDSIISKNGVAHQFGGMSIHWEKVR